MTTSRTIGGVTIPDTALVARAVEEARAVSEPYLFNHAVRSWLFLARQQGVDERRAQLIWYCLALNATLSVSPYAEPEVGICTVGAGVDLAGFLSERIPKGTMESILAAFPRLQMKRRMTECLSGIARARPQTTYDNFLRDFGERFVAGYKSPMSTVDLLSNAPFSE